MALIKCSDCGKEINDESSSCMYFGNPIIKINTSNKSFDDAETENTKASIMLWAYLTVVVAVVLGMFIMIFGLIALSDGGIIYVLLGIGIMISGFLAKIVLMWMAYMLQNVHELNVNTRK